MNTTKRSYLKDFLVVVALAAVFVLSPIGALFAEAFSTLSNYLTIKPVVASTGRTVQTEVGDTASSITMSASETAGTRTLEIAVDDDVPESRVLLGDAPGGNGIALTADADGGYLVKDGQILYSGKTTLSGGTAALTYGGLVFDRCTLGLNSGSINDAPRGVAGTTTFTITLNGGGTEVVAFDCWVDVG